MMNDFMTNTLLYIYIIIYFHRNPSHSFLGDSPSSSAGSPTHSALVGRKAINQKMTKSSVSPIDYSLLVGLIQVERLASVIAS